MGEHIFWYVYIKYSYKLSSYCYYGRHDCTRSFTQVLVSFIFSPCLHTRDNFQVSIMTLDFSWFTVSFYLLLEILFFFASFLEATKVSYLNIKLPACKIINFFYFLLCSVKRDWYIRATLVCFQVCERGIHKNITSFKAKLCLFSHYRGG